MKKILLLGALSLTLSVSFSAYAQSDSSLARQFVNLSANGNFEAAQKFFLPDIRSKITPGMLKIAWNKYMQSYGVFRGISSMKYIPQDSLHTWMTNCRFEKADIILALTFDSTHQMAGFHINRILPKRTKQKRSHETDTAIAVKGGKIAGSLLLPKEQKNKVPVVLIIPGSGPVDRNGNAGMTLHTDTYRMLADALAAHGIASFRYDKRGVGESSALVSDPRKIRFKAFVDDATALARFLKKDSAFSDVILLGHSQGALTGMLVAQQVNVAGYISLEGAGESIDKVLYWQLSRKKTPAQKQALKKIIDSLKAGHEVTATGEYPVFNKLVQPLLMSWMKIDPALEIQKLPMPILIINGTTDLQVTTDQAQKLQAAAPNAQLNIIEGMNHILKTAPAERAINLGTYSKPDLPLNKELVMDVVAFISNL